VPEREDHRAGLEERDVLGREVVADPPAERLVEGDGGGQVGDAQRYQREPLVDR